MACAKAATVAYLTSEQYRVAHETGTERPLVTDRVVGLRVTGHGMIRT